MKVAIWDTYVKLPDSSVIHFDIIVPDEIKEHTIIFSYGEIYLNSITKTGEIDADHCQYCHIEEPTEQMLNDINGHGYSILRMEDIPAQLRQNATRREMILHLRGHNKEYRFADFKGMPDKELVQIIQSASQKH
jgi:hypothetical protein